MARLSDNSTIYDFIEEMKRVENKTPNKNKQKQNLIKEIKRIKEKIEKSSIDTVN